MKELFEYHCIPGRLGAIEGIGKMNLLQAVRFGHETGGQLVSDIPGIGIQRVPQSPAQKALGKASPQGIHRQNTIEIPGGAFRIDGFENE